MDDNCYAKMATCGKRQESASPTTSKSSMEKNGNVADKDVQQLIGHQEEHSPQPQWISTLKEENIHFLHVKEEEEELRITQDECRKGPTEADPAKLLLTVVSVKTEDHEDKPEDHQLIGHQDEHCSQPQEISTLKQENLHFFHVKKEEEELCITPEGEFFSGPGPADPTKLQVTVVSVKTEDHGDQLEADNFLSPLSNSEAEDSVKEPSSSDTDCEEMSSEHGWIGQYTKYSVLCSDHFERSSFEEGPLRRAEMGIATTCRLVLKKGAGPTFRLYRHPAADWPSRKAARNLYFKTGKYPFRQH
ncbi:uncharacterized protein LOC133554611 isoform X4 [Nerophis ophidion]|uniref:uncharacterized protein LOC133554611 isoform X4 n=1 Tax=Nerophis ophidion TaxID=159077 RepID=UPI002AE05F61|nr:uncharacterized protein LOC133554611 isoform X4 [Nerophis ophidion]